MINKYTDKQIVVILLLLSMVAIFCSSIIVDRVIVGGILIASALLGAKEKSYVNPFYLFLFAPFSLLIYFNIGDLYMVNLTHNTFLLAIINMVAFIAGLVFTKRFDHISSCISISSTRQLSIHAILLMTVGYLSNYIISLQSILWIFTFAGVVCALKSKRKSMYLVVALFFLLSALSGTASKTSMLTYVVSILICYDKYFVETETQKRRMIYLGIIGIIFMVFAFSFANKDRGRFNADDSMDVYTNNGVEWNHSANLFMPYMYITNGWTNLQYITETQDSRTNGLWFVRPVLGYLGLKDNYSHEYGIITYSSFNTTTFIAVAFKDFGYWLSILMSLFLGFFVKKVYTRYLISKSPFDVTCYVLVGLATLEMFFSNHFFMQSYPFTVIILMEIYKRFCVGKHVVETEYLVD